jgi:ribonuclease P protein component
VDFQLVMSHGSRSRGKLVTVLALLRDDDQSIGRVGITVSKKVGNAVQRNLVRRRIKSIIRNFSLSTDYLVVIIARPEARLAAFGNLSQEIEHRFSKLDLEAPASVTVARSSLKH